MENLRSQLLAFVFVALVFLAAGAAWSVSLLAGDDVLAMAATPTPTKTPGFVRAVSHTPQIRLAVPPLPTATLAPASRSPATLTPPAEDASPPTPPAFVLAVAKKHGLNPMGDFLLVDQDSQTLYIMEKGRLLAALAVTTGDPAKGWETPSWFGVVGEYWGTFQGLGGVMADDGWWLFQRGGNFLIHGLPYRLNEQGEKVYVGWDDLGAAPASRGCIRLSPEDARWLTSWNPQGKPIIILPFSQQ